MLWDVNPNRAEGLAEQIAANIRRGIADGTLPTGECLPPATQLGRLLEVNPNTVLVAYRALRDEGLLEFRRGRGVRVIKEPSEAALYEAGRQFILAAKNLGYRHEDLPTLVQRLDQGLS